MYCEQCQTEVSGKFVDDQFVCQHCETELPLETSAVSASVTQNAKEFLRKWAAQQNEAGEHPAVPVESSVPHTPTATPAPVALERSDDSLEKLIAEAERKSQELRQRADRLLKEDEIETPSPQVAQPAVPQIAKQNTPSPETQPESIDAIRERMAAAYAKAPASVQQSLNAAVDAKALKPTHSQPQPSSQLPSGAPNKAVSAANSALPPAGKSQRKETPPLPTRRAAELPPDITTARIPNPKPEAKPAIPMTTISSAPIVDETPLPTSSLPDVQLAIDEFRRQRSNWTGFLGQWLGFIGTMAGLGGLIVSVLLAQGKLTVTPLLGYPLAAAGALVLILGLSLSVGSAFDILSKQNAWVFEHLLKELRRRDERIQQLAQKIDRQVKSNKKAA